METLYPLDQVVEDIAHTTAADAASIRLFHEGEPTLESTPTTVQAVVQSAVKSALKSGDCMERAEKISALEKKVDEAVMDILATKGQEEAVAQASVNREKKRKLKEQGATTEGATKSRQSLNSTPLSVGLSVKNHPTKQEIWRQRRHTAKLDRQSTAHTHNNKERERMHQLIQEETRGMTIRTSGTARRSQSGREAHAHQRPHYPPNHGSPRNNPTRPPRQRLAQHLRDWEWNEHNIFGPRRAAAAAANTQGSQVDVDLTASKKFLRAFLIEGV
jgi:hypothetical protein